jgi:hypothetical protein
LSYYHHRQSRKKSCDDSGGGGKGGGGGGEERKENRDDTYLNCGRHGEAVRMAQVEEEEVPPLFLAHANPVLRPKEKASEGGALASPHTHSTLPLTSSALLHIDELHT